MIAFGPPLAGRARRALVLELSTSYQVTSPAQGNWPAVTEK